MNRLKMNKKEQLERDWEISSNNIGK